MPGEILDAGKVDNGSGTDPPAEVYERAISIEVAGFGLLDAYDR